MSVFYLGAVCGMMKRPAGVFKKPAGESSTKKSKVPANQLQDLIPPDGVIWRGSTHWQKKDPESSDVDPKFLPYPPTEFRNEFGVPLHLLRTFRFPGNQNFTEDEKRFINEGGIMWYGWQPQDWKGCAAGHEDAKLKRYAAAIKSVAPAQVMVCPGWEPEGHCVPVAKAGHAWGNAKDYKKFYEHVVDVFNDEGVTNAVWIMDFSHKPSFDPQAADLLEDLVPDLNKVPIKWVFWNMFQTHTQHTFETATRNQPGKGFSDYRSRVHIRFWMDKFTKSEVFRRIPAWGIGAWGTKARTEAPEPWQKDIDQPDRERFIEGVKEFLDGNLGWQPGKIKAVVYFNSLDSIITEYPGDIVTRGDHAHNYELTRWKKSPELIPTFKEYLTCKPFINGDLHYFE